jgi:hypothetical protein
VILVSEHQDKQVRPEQLEQRSLMTDVGLPIAQSLISGGAGGLAGAWGAQKLGGQQQQPPPKQDD